MKLSEIYNIQPLPLSRIIQNSKTLHAENGEKAEGEIKNLHADSTSK